MQKNKEGKNILKCRKLPIDLIGAADNENYEIIAVCKGDKKFNAIFRNTSSGKDYLLIYTAEKKRFKWEQKMATGLSAPNNIFLLDKRPLGCGPTWAAGDLGMVGQGKVRDPVSLLVDHIALTFNDTEIYDPSYGYKKNWNRAQYEDDNLDITGGLIFSYDGKYYFWIGSLNKIGVPETEN